MEIRLKKWFSGLNQFSSVISCLDMLYHFLRMRKKTRVVEGAYIVRTDVELLRDDLSKWPTDKLCFLWRTAYKGLKTPVNDVEFFIPQSCSIQFDKLWHHQMLFLLSIICMGWAEWKV